MIAQHQNECLQQASQEALQKLGWSEFAAYCRDREQGLRQTAFAHLDNFVSNAKDWPFESRREFTDWLCGCLVKFGESSGHGIVPHPLKTEIVIPTLEEWMKTAPLDSTPCRWAGMFFSNVVYGGVRSGLIEVTDSSVFYLQEALRRNENDEMARIRLIESFVGNAGFACHHLPFYYIGEPAEGLLQLDMARKLLLVVAEDRERIRLEKEISEVSQMTDDWIVFLKSQEQDFNQWAINHGRNYQWSQSYYYQK